MRARLPAAGRAFAPAVAIVPVMRPAPCDLGHPSVESSAALDPFVAAAAACAVVGPPQPIAARIWTSPATAPTPAASALH